MILDRPATARAAPSRMLATLVLGAVLAGSSCAHFREAIGLGPRRPKVELVGIELKQASLAAVDVVLTLEVDNPNDFELAFAKLRYQMDAAGVRIAQGTYEDRIAIPAEKKAQVRLPLAIDPIAAMKVLRDAVDQGTAGGADALLKATADFETPVGMMEVNFEETRPLRKLLGR
jgi:LEA14-like dessication related protein